MVECDSPWPMTDRQKELEAGLAGGRDCTPGRGEERILLLREVKGVDRGGTRGLPPDTF